MLPSWGEKETHNGDQCFSVMPKMSEEVTPVNIKSDCGNWLWYCRTLCIF